MIIPGTGYESASGGPFFRDINNQGGMLAIFVLHGVMMLIPRLLKLTGDQQELYFCKSSNYSVDGFLTH